MNQRRPRRLYQVEDISIDIPRELVELAWVLVIACGAVWFLLEVLNYARSI